MECPKLFTRSKEEQKWMQKVKRKQWIRRRQVIANTTYSRRFDESSVYVVKVLRKRDLHRCGGGAAVYIDLFVCRSVLLWSLLYCCLACVCCALYVVCCDFVRIVRDAKCGYVNNRTTRIQYKSTERWRLFCATVRMISLVVTNNYNWYDWVNKYQVFFNSYITVHDVVFSTWKIL